MNMEMIGSEWVGRLIDKKYALLQFLSSSESGSVFLTESEKTSWPRLVIKLLPADGANTKSRIAGWTTATTLSHPNLMPLIDCGRCRIDDTRLIYSVTPYSEELLSQILAQRALTPAEIEDLLKPVIDALSFLHGKGFVHGHLKPSNLMVLGDNLKLSTDSLEAVGNSGTHHKPADVYDAPERARKIITPAADVWSLGVTLIEALVQHPPGWKPAMTRAPIVPKAVPEPWAGIAKECLRRRPESRCTLTDLQIRLVPGLPPQSKPAAEGVITAEPATEPATEAPSESKVEAATEPPSEPIAESAPEAVTESVTAIPAETAVEPVVESITETVTEPAEETAAEQAAKASAESTTEAATERPSEPIAESAPEAAPEPVVASATDSAPETTIEPVEEATTESAAVPQPEPETEPIPGLAAEPAAEPAAASIGELTAESLPDFKSKPAGDPKEEHPRFHISPTNGILLAILGLFVFAIVVILSVHPPSSSAPTSTSTSTSTSPAKNQPQTSASSAPAETPGTVPGEVSHKVMPDVPPSESAKISGTIEVKVLVTVDPNGQIDNAILNVPGSSPALASLAQETAQKWSFKPALVKGTPVSSFWVLEFRFSRGSTQVIPFEVSP